MTFLQPLFLLGIIFASVPIIIHLWFHKKLPRIPFPSLKFLKKTEAKRLGWLKLREIIILILRCLIILFIFLSLAKPQVKNPILGAKRLASVVLIIDNSYSMAYGDNFELARKAAVEIAAHYSAKSEFLILPLCEELKAKSRPALFWKDKKSALEDLEKISLSNQSGNLHKMLSKFSIPPAHNIIEYIYIGDGQELTFRDFSEKSISKAHFYWLKIPAGSNITINQVVLKDPISVPGKDYTLVIKLTNHSNLLWRGKINLKANAYQREKDCQLAANSNSLVEIIVPSSIKHGKITLYDDSLLIDNTYYFSKVLPEKLHILIVGNSFYLESALKPSKEINTPFNITTVPTLKNIVLKDFDLLILNGISALTPAETYRLKNFINRPSKGIILFLGEEMNNELQHFLKDYCTFEKNIKLTGYVTLDWVDYEHPIFQAFKKNQILKNIKIYCFQKLSSDKKIIARVTGNDPFLILDKNITVVATQFIPHCTDIVYKSAFVPLLYRLIIYTCQATENKEFYVGQTNEYVRRLKSPSGIFLDRGDKFLKPGTYTTEHETIAVNVNPQEGALKILSQDMAKMFNIKIIDINRDLQERNLSTLFLYLALIALVIELFLLTL